MKELEIRLSIDEINMILSALGQMPYIKVYTLMQEIQQQASAQIQEVNESHNINKELHSINKP